MAKPFVHLWLAATLSAAVVLDSRPIGRAWADEPLDRAAAPVADGNLTLFLAGDAIITQPWSGDADPGFRALIGAIRGTDVALVNLELTLHDFEGYAQADSGGMHLAARPRIAHELAWAGIDMVSGANNHAFDYGSTGVLDTLDSVAAAGMAIAGSGRDLQAARAPAYFTHPDGTVALVSTAATFVPYGKASHTRPDLHGRPGPQPADHREAAGGARARGGGDLDGGRPGRPAPAAPGRRRVRHAGLPHPGP